MEEFRSSITPVLTVRDAAQAIVFYGRAFGAEEIYRNTYPEGRIVAELAVEGARFRVADEAPEASLSPQTLQGTTVRINLLVADPDELAARAIANGSTEVAPVADQRGGEIRRTGRRDRPEDGTVPAAGSTEVFACTLLSSPSEWLSATPLSLTLTSADRF